ncbi:sodium/pantothenate symporter [Oceanobacillus jeddahense]|uniref:Sodium/pantothenate symporter n=1 Tax=Oceanobacillus jeddahense TaxID=1462527 RepID=A0ABY5JYN4_9BACI|nr:sodium/pantothenate symporter [Oceanobacillus jeddahense]UUI04268.1 sodium/pantothenate symporter [Oceanobacillus jeddahense]
MRLDILIPIILYLLATLLVGSYFHKHLKNNKSNFHEEFFVGGRSLGPLVLAFTMVASAASAGTFIGATGVGYEQGFSWPLVIACQTAMGVYILGILGKKFAIISRRIGAVTITDFLKERYQSHAVIIASALGILIFISAYMVAQFAGGARILEAVTGFPYQWGLLIFGAVVVLLTVFGGYRGVAITDAIQGFAMLLGGILVWVIIMVKTNGFEAIVSQLTIDHPEMVTLPGASGVTPTLLFSYFLLFGIAMIGLPHAAVRGMTFKDSKSMHKGMIYAVIIMGLFSIGFASIGPMVRVLLPGVEVPDMALILLIVELVPGWLAGLILAAPLAAIISTVDSMLLVTSSTIVKDLFLNYINPNASERTVTNLSYFSTLFIGTAVVLIALTPPELIQFVVIFAIGGLEATLFAVIVFGLYWKRANKWGAIASMTIGFVSYVAATMMFENPFGMDPIGISLFLNITSMIVFSYMTEKPSFEIINKFWGAEPSPKINQVNKNLAK